MRFRHHSPSDRLEIARLFSQVFSESEGQAEGRVIGALATNLFESSNDDDLYNFVAEHENQQVGSIFLTRLRFEHSCEAFMLAPVAVRSDFQGRGIGQALIEYGLNELRNAGVQFVLTYGDPAFYSKVGFHHISDEAVRPPFPLTQPEGWLGLSLGSDPIEGLSGSCSCVSAFCDAAYW